VGLLWAHISTFVTRTDVITTETPAPVRRAFEFQGVFARVARRLSVSRQHVYHVAKGQRQSRRVMRALLAEIQRIERRAA
jgi:hypothetical protein